MRVYAYFDPEYSTTRYDVIMARICFSDTINNPNHVVCVVTILNQPENQFEPGPFSPYYFQLAAICFACASPSGFTIWDAFALDTSTR